MQIDAGRGPDTRKRLRRVGAWVLPRLLGRLAAGGPRDGGGAARVAHAALIDR